VHFFSIPIIIARFDTGRKHAHGWRERKGIKYKKTHTNDEQQQQQQELQQWRINPMK